MVHESTGEGLTHVSNPADPNIYRDAAAGDVYVEFDVPESLVLPAGSGWGIIAGPSSIYGRLAASQGLPPLQMPPATNIEEFGPEHGPGKEEATKVASATDDDKVDVQRWVSDHGATLAGSAIQARAVPLNPAHAEHTKASQAIQLERKGYMGEVIIWSSGECELLYGGRVSEVKVQQRRVRSQRDLDAVMSEMLSVMDARS